ncbi:MAG: Uma2 family endonuclease [Thermomicrobiales bacterium]|nr:Uma2 family endonuclease [Thermomicrobiales bacterium]
MSTLSRALIYADLERARESHDERLELIEGELFVTPSPAPMHQPIILRLSRVLDETIVESGLGVALPAPIDVVFSQQTVLQPDFLVLVGERAELFRNGTIEGPPSLVIEVLSPSTRKYDRETKRQLYARYGVPEYWMFDPDTRSVTIACDLVDGRYQHESTHHDVANSRTIPALSIELPPLFAMPRRFQDEE